MRAPDASGVGQSADQRSAGGTKVTMNEHDWPPIRLHSVNVEASAQWSRLAEVVPVFTRQPYRDWCLMFDQVCQESLGEAWKGAGFVRCEPGEVDAIEARFLALVDEANERFRELLERARVHQPIDVAELIALEGALAASDEGLGYLCTLFAF
jgi:hypothetical protein